MNAQRDVDARVHIFTATSLGWGRVAKPTLAHLYTGEVSVLILQETEWTPGPIWTRRSEESPPSSWCLESNPDHPARSQNKRLAAWTIWPTYIWSKTLMELIFNPVVNFDEVRRIQLAKFSLIMSTMVPLGSFRSFNVCSDAKERVWCGK